MRDQIQKLIDQKNLRKTELNQKVGTAQTMEELKAISDELDGLNAELRDLEAMLSAADNPPAQAPPTQEPVSARTLAVNSQIPGVVVGNAAGQESRTAGGNGDIERRIDQLAEDLRSGKEVTITAEIQKHLEQRAVQTTDVLLENKYSRNIGENFNEVAQTVDLVDSFPLTGGKSYTVPIQISDGNADYTSEGATYVNDEAQFEDVSTGYAKITNSAIITEEAIELPNADYLTRIVNSLRKSLRKKTSNQIIAGGGGTGQLRGIYNMPSVVIPPTYQVTVPQIDKDTLRKIVFSYGGSEDVESPATLFLSKEDLAAFASIVATGDGRPYYAITYNGASGTIQEVGGGLRVPYTINSACTALSNATTQVGVKTMVYGAPTNYELPMFAPMKIKRSDERYIDQGKVGFFASIIVGGVVNRYGGFIPVVKGDASPTASIKLSSLTIGSLTLSPAFDPDVKAYTASTTNSTNQITVATESGTATVEIDVNGSIIPNGTSATWVAGANSVAIKVTDGGNSGTYTVTVTKS